MKAKKKVYRKSTKQFYQYDGKYSDWTVLSLNQLSFVNNVFLTFGIALFSYTINKNYRCGDSVELSILIIIILLLSIAYGLSVLITRLYDFRITRHLVLVRTWFKYYLKDDLKFPVNNNSHIYSSGQRLITFLTIIFIKLNFITESEIKKWSSGEIKKPDINETVYKIKELQKIINILGTATWRWLKLQILFFLLSLVIYSYKFIIK